MRPLVSWLRAGGSRGRPPPQSCTRCPLHASRSALRPPCSTRPGSTRPGRRACQENLVATSPGGGPPDESECQCVHGTGQVHNQRMLIGPANKLQKGGDPAAPSGTATLLRLRPNRRSHLRQLPPKRVGPLTSGVTDFHDVTGGVYKARERIHRSVADLRLLATPTSCSRVADCNPN